MPKRGIPAESAKAAILSRPKEGGGSHLDLERQQGLGILAPGAKSPGRKPAPAHARPEVAETGSPTTARIRS
jgi:hypothetical protein